MMTTQIIIWLHLISMFKVTGQIFAEFPDVDMM